MWTSCSYPTQSSDAELGRSLRTQSSDAELSGARRFTTARPALLSSAYYLSAATCSAVTVGAELPKLVRSWFTTAATSSSVSCPSNDGIADV